MHYILGDNHEVIHEPDALKCARWFENNDRHVAMDYIDGYRVSTVFLSIDHNFLDTGQPLVFETMVFEGEGFDEEYYDRYETWDEAVEGHQRAIQWAKTKRSKENWLMKLIKRWVQNIVRFFSANG